MSGFAAAAAFLALAAALGVALAAAGLLRAEEFDAYLRRTGHTCGDRCRAETETHWEQDRARWVRP